MWSPFAGIFTGLALSVFDFLFQSSQTVPVSGVSSGHLSMSRTKRPAARLDLGPVCHGYELQQEPESHIGYFSVPAESKARFGNFAP